MGDTPAFKIGTTPASWPAFGAPAVSMTATATTASVAASSVAAPTTTWFFVPASLASNLERTATLIQALARRYIVIASKLPGIKAAAKNKWVESRRAEFGKLKQTKKEQVESAMHLLFQALPRSSPSQCFLASALSTTKTSAGIPQPNRSAIVELFVELQQTVGFKGVKRFIYKLVEDSVRFHAAGKPMGLTHLLLSGGIGSGRKTAAKLIAKAFCAVGVFSSESIDYIKSKGERFSSGQVNFVDHASKIAPFDAQFNSLHSGSDTQPQFVILAARTAAEVSTVAGASTYLHKREPTRMTLPALTTPELAQITLQQLAKIGRAHV